jgi:UrcA family protein
MSKIVNRIAVAAALALAATPIIGLSAAHAASRAMPVARVAIGDLNLSQPEGAREFQRRADRAAQDACGARKVRGLSYRACLMDIAADLRQEMSPAQRSALLTGQKAQPTAFASR